MQFAEKSQETKENKCIEQQKLSLLGCVGMTLRNFLKASS